MKIIHCADLHLGKRPSGTKKFSNARYEDFFRAFASLIDRISALEIDVFIIAGDFFDKREINANILEKTEVLLQRLLSTKQGLKIIAIEGNHDVIQSQEDSWLEYLGKKGYMEVYSYKKDFAEKNFFQIEDIRFYPVGYPGFMVDEALKELAEVLSPEEKNIVMVHTGISGSDTLPGLVSTKILDLFQGKAMYIAAGHIHSFTVYPKEDPYFFIPGSLEFTNVPNERADKKGVIYFDTDTREHEFIEIESRKRVRGKIFSYENDLEEEFEAYVRALHLTGEEFLLVSVQNRKKEYINTDVLEEIAMNCGAFKSYFEINNPSFQGEQAETEGILSIEAMEKTLIEGWNILKKVENFSSKFPLLKHLHEEEDREQFIKAFDQILEEDEV